ncbi:response regulator transcription factor [Ferroacidibacillus organovorans]|uniref:DNA-binding response regulator n=1 Tax=Ferroacidibacillus organovorans TaxID=1765683 RepID=A0A1V4ETE0_9BACL|nr:response regulator transcription factor [Ferroacidibacillus organovorans]OPG16120.1 hypothetical protein B2M26_08755 [Ferroacidibacillus organovorans]
MQRHILIVDDEAAMRQLVRIYLAHAGFSVSEAKDGVSCMEKLSAGVYDMVILDMMMPGMDGVEVCRRIRERLPEMPLLMLTARDEVESRVKGLTAGADDYLTKPFDSRELVARVKSLLRRTQPRDEVEYAIPEYHLRMDVETRNATVREERLALTPKEFDLLALFVKWPGRTYTRDELLDRVWGPEYEGDTRTVDSHIKNIREKLRDAGLSASILATVWGIGYRFEVPK